jgi:hypothetical protein
MANEKRQSLTETVRQFEKEIQDAEIRTLAAEKRAQEAERLAQAAVAALEAACSETFTLRRVAAVDDGIFGRPHTPVASEWGACTFRRGAILAFRELSTLPQSLDPSSAVAATLDDGSLIELILASGPSSARIFAACRTRGEVLALTAFLNGPRAAGTAKKAK